MEGIPAVSLERVSKRYGSGPKAVTALNGLSLRVPPGEFLAVTGPSGSGKSTLLNLIAGLETPDSGRVEIDGRDLAGLSDDARSDLRLQQIGFIFQSFNLFATFTVEENIAWPLEFLGYDAELTRRRTAAALAQVGLEATARHRRPAELSGGEQQRVAVARALVTEPRLLLADEPTGNLDSRTGEAVLDLLRALNAERQLTVILVTHNTTFARIYGHRTIELRDGRVVREPGAGNEPTGTRVRPPRAQPAAQRRDLVQKTLVATSPLTTAWLRDETGWIEWTEPAGEPELAAAERTAWTAIERAALRRPRDGRGGA